MNRQASIPRAGRAGQGFGDATTHAVQSPSKTRRRRGPATLQSLVASPNFGERPTRLPDFRRKFALPASLGSMWAKRRTNRRGARPGALRVKYATPWRYPPGSSVAKTHGQAQTTSRVWFIGRPCQKQKSSRRQPPQAHAILHLMQAWMAWPSSAPRGVS